MEKPESKLAFLQASLEAQRRNREHLDQKASILVGVSSIIFILSASRLQIVGFAIIALFSLIACLLCVWTISFPFRKIDKNKFGLICYLGFYNLSFKEYYNKLTDALRSEDEIIKEFAREVYALAQYSVKLKARWIRFASLSLSVGLILGLIFIFIV